MLHGRELPFKVSTTVYQTLYHCAKNKPKVDTVDTLPNTVYQVSTHLTNCYLIYYS
uniref:Uncharacterized protein n=1 Tax=Caudovirales sp. ct7964 TaxID=2825758 RepID=A0A8S5PF10_9CAUD|nr:MAG TPA: hypothetical protein [Caudovirales sp. ct7964]DAL09804.1 MAG TPA_asm: hypothetical protein [Caudoviricetes sp.]